MIEHRRRLDAIERRVLHGARLPEDRLGYRYRTTLAGFSARLSASEVQRLRQQPEVGSVTADRIWTASRRPSKTGPPAAHVENALARVAATPSATGAAPAESAADLRGQTAEFLGLPDGLWARLGGPEQAGEGVVIGVIDGGIFPEHPSFADQPIAADGSQNYIGPAFGPPPATWRGICQEGENFPATTCNNKLIGARWFVDGWGSTNVAEEDFLSARDVDGHGTGMASIAAGNYGVDPSFQGNDLGLGVISGIAPRARIAHYKALWAIPAFDGAGFGSESDLTAAVDAAVADGVDIISMSISGPLGETMPITDQSTMLDAWSQSLLRAFDAGVLAVLAAGNDGPEAGSVDSPSQTPWVVSAGMSALPNTFIATATVSGGPGGPTVMVQGASPNPGLSAVPLIDAADAAAPGVSRREASECEPGTLDPALVQGKAVVCNPISLFYASGVVHQAGAAGAVFVSPGGRPVPDDYLVPTVVVTPADAAQIRQVMAGSPNATIELTAGTLSPTTTGDIVQHRSARGPAARSESILKPDLVAPGADMVVAHTLDVPPGARELFDFTLPGLFRPLHGTSLAVPNIAGSAALLLALDPELDPSGLKSALMTTAQPDILKDTAGVPSARATPLDRGAGRIEPNRAADPGLVLYETTERFESYVAAQVPSRDLSQPTVQATDLNLPSIAFDPLVGPRSTRRTFTSVDAQPGTWTASVEGLAGIAVTATPGEFTVDPGQSATMEFSFVPSDPAQSLHVDGAVVLTNTRDGRTVRLPVVLRPEAFEAPDQLNFGAGGSDGRVTLPLPTGFEGQLSARGYGLARPETRRDQTVGMDEVEEDLDRIAQPGPGVAVFDLRVPDGANALAVEIGGAALGDEMTDLDLYVFHDDDGDGFDARDLTAESLTFFTRESVRLLSPDPGPYRISVRGFRVVNAATFDLTTWLLADPTPNDLTDPPGPGLRVFGDPQPVTIGGVAGLDLEWSGLDEPGVYLGLVSLHNTAVPLPDDTLGEMVVAVTRY